MTEENLATPDVALAEPEVVPTGLDAIQSRLDDTAVDMDTIDADLQASLRTAVQPIVRRDGKSVFERSGFAEKGPEADQLDAFQGAFFQDNIGVKAFNAWERLMTGKRDQEYKLTDHPEVFEGIRPEYHSRFLSVRNAEHAEVLRRQAIADQLLIEKASGLESTGLHILATVLQPEVLGSLGAMGAIGGGVRGIHYLSTTTKAPRIAAAAQAARGTFLTERTTFEIARFSAGEVAITDGTRALIDEDFTMVEALVNTAFAGTLGFGIGKLVNRNAFRRHTEALVVASRLEAEGTELSAQALQATQDAHRFFETAETGVTETNTAGFNTGTIAERMINSDNPVARLVGTKLFRKQTLVAGGVAEKGGSANDLMTQTTEKMNRVFGDRFRGGFAEHQRLGGTLSENEFSARLGRQLRYGDDADEHIQAVAKSIRDEVLIPIGRDLREKGVAGFQNLSDDDLASYMIRQYRSDNVFKLINDPTVGKKGIRSLFVEALRRGIGDSADLSDDLIQRIGRGVANKVMNQATGAHTTPTAGEMLAGVEDVLDDALDAIDELLKMKSFDTQEARTAIENLQDTYFEGADIISLLHDMKRRSDAGNITRGRRRVSFDERTSVTLDGGRVISFGDLLEDNVKSLIPRYIATTSGPAALAEKLAIHSLDDWKKMANELITEAGEKGGDAAAKDMAKLMDHVERHFYGRSQLDNPESKMWQAARIFGNLTFSKVMTKLVIAMMPEIVAAAGLQGFKAFTTHGLPMVTKLHRRLANGDLEDEVARGIQAFTGLGSDQRKRFPLDFVEELQASHVNAQDKLGQALTKAEKASAWLADKVARLSAPMDTALRIGTANMFIQTFADLSHGLTRVGQKGLTEARLRQVGLSSETAEGIAKALRDPRVSKVVDGAATPVNLYALRKYHPEAALDFELAIVDWTNRRVQKGDFGNTHLWMHHPVAQLVMQFRSYGIHSINRQLQSEISGFGPGGDNGFSLGRMLLATAAMGSLGHLASTSLKHAGSADFSDKMKEASDPMTLVTEGFMRTMAFNIIFSTFTGSVGGRGAPADALIGLPSTGIFNDAVWGAKGVIDGVSEGDAGAVVDSAGRFLQVRNVLGFTQGINALERMVSPDKDKPTSKFRTEDGRIMHAEGNIALDMGGVAARLGPQDTPKDPKQPTPTTPTPHPDEEDIMSLLQGTPNRKGTRSIPTTPPSRGTPTRKAPPRPATKLDTAFIAALQSVENGQKKGFVRGKWYPHASPEGGTDTVAYGHKLTPAEERSGIFKHGISEQQALDLFKADIAQAEGTAASQFEAYAGIPFDQLPRKYQLVLTNIAFNTGSLHSKKTGSFLWVKLVAGMQANDDKAVRQEMVTSFAKGRLVTRARTIADAVGLAK